MSNVYTTSTIRAAEEAVLRSLPQGALMQRAAFALAGICTRLLREQRGRVYGARVIILAGGGDNGRDALWAGRYLAKHGASVRAVSVPEREEMPETTVDMVLDGITGIGASGPLREYAYSYVDATQRLRAQGACVVSVDIPSGVNPDTGVVSGPAITADHTVTFGALKPALVVTPGSWRAGQVHPVDVGLTEHLDAPIACVTTQDECDRHWPCPTGQSTKYTRGVVGVVAGSPAYPGAAMLATMGALAGPAGMVRYVGPIRREVVTAHPEVIVADSLGSAGRVQAWVVGPGLGRDVEARTLVTQLIARDLPLVLDADALAVLDDEAFQAIRRRKAPTVLTPHEGEFTRLFGPLNDGGRLRALRDAARSLRAVVVLKGDRTLTADGAGGTPVHVGPDGAYALAAAGTGDLLAGVIGSLLAGGVGASRAASLGVLRHAQAGRRAAEHCSSVTASTVGHILKEW